LHFDDVLARTYSKPTFPLRSLGCCRHSRSQGLGLLVFAHGSEVHRIGARSRCFFGSDVESSVIIDSGPSAERSAKTSQHPASGQNVARSSAGSSSTVKIDGRRC